MEPNSETGQVKAVGTRTIRPGRQARTEAQRSLCDGVRYTIGRTEATISMAIPDSVKAKSVHWRVTNTSVVLGVIGQPPMVDGQLWGRVLEDECHWQIDVVEARAFAPAAHSCLARTSHTRARRSIPTHGLLLRAISGPALRGGHADKAATARRQGRFLGLPAHPGGCASYERERRRPKVLRCCRAGRKRRVCRRCDSGHAAVSRCEFRAAGCRSRSIIARDGGSGPGRY